MQNFNKTDEELFERLYKEWRLSEEAVLSRAETLGKFTQLMNREREVAFIAGCECAIVEIVKRLEALPDKTESQ